MPSPPSSDSCSSSDTRANEKYKDSCDACARSKVRCDKIKPTCGRCVMRHTSCQYLQSKRSPRKQDKPRRRQSKSLDNHLLNRPIQPAGDTQQPSSAGPAFPMQDLSSQSVSSSASLSLASDSSIELGYLWSAKDITNANSNIAIPPRFESFNELAFAGLGFDCASLFDFAPSSVPQPAEGDIPCTDNLSSTASSLHTTPPPSIGQNALEYSGHQSTCWDVTAVAMPHNAPTAQIVDRPTKCTCASTGLWQLKNLLLNDTDDIRSDTVVPSATAENGLTVEHINKLLQQSCPHNEYVFIIITMMISKVLDRYKAAVRQVLLSHDGAETHSPSYACANATNSDEARVAGQLILGELHGVQRLIRLFSERIDPSKSSFMSVDNGVVLRDPLPPDDSRTDEGTASLSPLSVNMLMSMKKSLSDRLRALSNEILGRLRQE